MAKFPKKKMVEAVFSGIRSAQKTYEQWSGDWLSDAGVESLVCAKIAEKIFPVIRQNNDDSWLTMETSLRIVADHSGATKRAGPLPKVLKGSPRADIVVWSGWEKVWGIIEVKRRFSWGELEKDRQRLRTVLERYGASQDGSIDFAGLAIPVACANDSDHTKIRETYSNIKQHMKSLGDSATVRTSEPFNSAMYRDHPSYKNYSHGSVFVQWHP